MQDYPAGWRWFSGLLMVLLLGALGWGVFGWARFSQPLQPDGRDSNLGLAYQSMQVASGSRKGSWMRTLSPSMEDVQGDLIWNNGQQKGVMRFLNLPDPRNGYRYHVWIYDSHSQVGGQAVSGAVLDKGSGKQEWFVSIQAAKPVVAPYKFVFTQESLSGGDESQILLMAQP